MSSAYHKLGDRSEARTNLEYSLLNQQELYNKHDKAVIDANIQFIILDREERSSSSLKHVQARIDTLKNNGSLKGKFERYYQVEHLQALVLLGQGESKQSYQILMSLLTKQANIGREANNRSLLWVRLTLATILRSHGKEDEAPFLFEHIVTPTTRGDVSLIWK